MSQENGLGRTVCSVSIFGNLKSNEEQSGKKLWQFIGREQPVMVIILFGQIFELQPPKQNIKPD